MDPLNVDDVEIANLQSKTHDEVAWSGGYFAYGGHDADRSCVITFSVPPGKRLGKHHDTAEETQFFLSGQGDLVRESGTTPVKPGDLVVLKIGEVHDLVNTGNEDLRVVAFFSDSEVSQIWEDDVWDPGDMKVTSSPNKG
jgi:mannose-6-phosphate isomerase-like protein (cupin superfamily)